MKVAGAVAIITGGARGLGKAFAEALLKDGAKVCVADVNVEEGKLCEAELQTKYNKDSVMFVKCDVTKEEDFKGVFSETINKFKNVSIMVNNAGILNETIPYKVIEVNLMGAIRGTDMAIEYMRKDKGGHGGLILNVASSGGLFPAFFMPSYCASKYGVVGYTRSWAANPSARTNGVSFAVLCPAFTETAMLHTATDETNNPILKTYNENKETIRGMIDGLGINSVDHVVEGFMGIVNKEDNNGAVVTVDNKTGINYRFKDHPHKL